MGVLSAYAFSFMSKYLHQSCGPKPMTRVDINDNNQSSNNIAAFKSWKEWSVVGVQLKELFLRIFVRVAT
jgi:hypothetical protein